MVKNSTGFVQTFEKGLQILEFLVEHKSVTVTTLARYMGIQKSSSFRFLNTLRLYGYVDQDDNSNYVLTGKIIELSKGVVPKMDFEKLVTQFMNELFKKNKNNNGVCNLGKWNGKEVVYILQTAHHYEQFQVGKTIPAYCSSLGKALLAFLPEEQLNSYINKTEFITYTGYTVDSKERLLEDLNFVRENGYATMFDELAPGLKSIAIPLIVGDVPIKYALSVSQGYLGGIERLTDEMLGPLQETADDIMSYMAHNNITS